MSGIQGVHNFRRVTEKLPLYRHAALDHVEDDALKKFYEKTNISYRVDLRSPLEVWRSELRGSPKSVTPTSDPNRKTLMAKRITAKTEGDESKMSLAASIATNLRPSDIFRPKRKAKAKTEQLVTHQTLMAARKKLELFNVNFISLHYIDNSLWDRCTLAEKWKLFTMLVTLKTEKLIQFVSSKLAWQGLVGSYYDFMDYSKDAIFEALRLITEGLEQGHVVSFSCMAGKDRSGMTAAIVKYIIGDSLDDIFDNYAESEKQYIEEGIFDHLKEEFIKQGLGAEFAGTPRQTMVDLFNYVKGKYGSIEGYLDQIGFDAEWRTRLHACCVEQEE